MLTVNVKLSDGSILPIQINDPNIIQPPPSTLYGYSTAITSLATSLNRGLKRPNITRIFDGTVLDMPASRFAEAPVVWISAKLPQLQAASWGTQVETYCRSTIPKTTKVLITAHHEPEGNKDASQTLTQWAAEWRKGITNITNSCAKLRAEGWDIWSAPIICDWVFEPKWGSAANIDLWYPLDGSIKADLYGFDCYIQGTGLLKTQICCLRMSGDYKVLPYADPTANDTYKWARLAAARAKALGKPWGIAESGIWRADRDSDLLATTTYTNPPKYKWSLEQRSQRFLDIYNDLKTFINPPSYVCWYLDGRCVVDDPITIATLNSTI